MLALIGVAAILLLIVGLLMRDQQRVAHARSIERGLNIVSTMASKRLQFRMPTRRDKDFLVTMASDQSAAAANGWRDDQAAIVSAKFNNRATFRLFRQNELVAFDRATSVQIGTATFSASPIGPKGSRSIGIHVHPDHRNQGYGREIMAAAIALMQFTPGPVFVGTRTDNAGLRKIMNQLGFEPEPDTRLHQAPNGHHFESVWYRCGSDIHPPDGLFYD